MTKYIICLGDGMADEPIPELNNKTPLAVAKTPNMDFIAREGQAGLVKTVPNGLTPGSDVANMGILGYDPRQYYTGRGPIEAVSMGLSIPPDKLVFRCNLCYVENGIMKDFTANHVSSEEGTRLLEVLNEAFKQEGVEFFPGVSYRNLATLPNKYPKLSSTAPHDILDCPIEDHYPKGDNQTTIITIMDRCHQILQNDSTIRKCSGSKPNFVWLWSQGPIPECESFESKFGLSGGIVTAVDLLKGLGKLMKLKTPTVEGATGFLDTNYANKVAAAQAILKTDNFVYLHVEAPDEAGHMGDFKLKIKAIEDFDNQIIRPMLEYQNNNPDTVILVLPDHPTPCSLKTHTNNPVPWAIYHQDIVSDDVKAYDELSCNQNKDSFNYPWELLNYFLNQPQNSQKYSRKESF